MTPPLANAVLDRAYALRGVDGADEVDGVDEVVEVDEAVAGERPTAPVTSRAHSAIFALLTGGSRGNWRSLGFRGERMMFVRHNHPMKQQF
ncbi:hypothetical protein [Streptomyces silvensis]|uniref:hypothetical protein n=1 Tax=Streptomyces silvensis TaxID=1765722 RepID=UPI001F52B416|nr:hypothetical protein [Streptomyces silvensis]